MLPELSEVRLDNGFRAILVQRRGLPVVACTLWYAVGSRDERTGETGLSHFLEHMMFKGTGRYAKGEIDVLTSRLGGSNNASTDNDCTTYYFSLASDRWETALEIEADRMINCALDPDEFAAEKRVVLEELAMYEDDAPSALFQAVESLAYQVHPYRHPVIGWREDLERLEVDGMRDYYRRHYGPNRAFLVVVGDLDVDRAAERVTELFGGLPATSEREVPLSEPAPSGERRSRVRTPGPLTRLAMVTKTCRMGERDDFTLDLIANVLGSGKGSRLHRRLVIDTELATHVGVFNHPRLDPGLWGIWCELRPGSEPDRVEGHVRDELDRLCRDGVTPAEVRRARVQVCSSYQFEDETVLDVAMKIGRFEAACAEGYRLLDSVIPTYDSISRAEIRQTANRYFAGDAWSVTWALPRDGETREVRRLGGRGRRRPAARKSSSAKRSASPKPPRKPRRKSKPKRKAKRQPRSTTVRKPEPKKRATAKRGSQRKTKASEPGSNAARGSVRR